MTCAAPARKPNRRAGAWKAIRTTLDQAAAELESGRADRAAAVIENLRDAVSSEIAEEELAA